MEQLGSLQERKALLRKELCQKRDALDPAERSRRTREILKRVAAHPKFAGTRSLLTYVAFGSEVETRPLLEEAWRLRKKVYVPRVDRGKKEICMIEIMSLKELKPGSYGILEPPLNSKRLGKPEDLDLAVIPGVGFDREGGRLGRGEGYFDRFLKEARNAYKIGLAFKCQIVERIPRGVNDATVDEVLIG